jgi:hypothetical protein
MSIQRKNLIKPFRNYSPKIGYWNLKPFLRKFLILDLLRITRRETLI